MVKKGVVWKLNHLLNGKKTDEIIQEIEKKVKKFEKYRKLLNKKISSKKIVEIVKLKENISVLFSRLHAYYAMKFAENNQDSNALTKMSALNQYHAEVRNRIRFFSIWFMKLDRKTASKLMKGSEEYRYYLECIRKDRPHTRSEEVENIIALKSITTDAFSDIYDVITNAFTFDFNGKKKLAQEEVTAFYQSTKSNLRKESYKSILSKYGENSMVLSEIYKNVVLDWYNEGINIRKHKNPISVRNSANDIPDRVVDTMLKVVKKNAKIFTEYFKLKHKIQKKNKDVYPFSRDQLYAPYKLKSRKKYPYNQSKKLVLETFKQFDERFYKAAKQIFDKGHVHSHPKPNKRSGAFCYATHTKETPYIMLNHTDQLKDVFTMMHEFGHGIHDIFAAKQKDMLFHPTLPMAETASIFGEMILTDRLLRESKNDNEKIFLLTRTINSHYGTIIRQAYFTMFEMFAHEKIKHGITKEDLEKEWMKSLEEQFGNMKIPNHFRYEWNYIPHIHHTPFYCYAYSWGGLVVLSFYAMYREQGKKFIEKLIKVLSAGGSDSPVNILKQIGVNPAKEEFWQKGFDIIKEEIGQLKKLV